MTGYGANKLSEGRKYLFLEFKEFERRKELKGNRLSKEKGLKGFGTVLGEVEVNEFVGQ